MRRAPSLPAFLVAAGLASALAAAPAGAAQVIRVPAQMDLQTAIANVADGGVIEIAPGTYPSPANGFLIANPGRSFTVRGEAGGTVTLDGGGTRPVLRLQNNVLPADDQVTFERLTFANGRSTTDFVGGAVSLTAARATFVDCVFRDSTSQAPASGGGGVHMWSNSVAHFLRSSWRDNTARNEGAGLRVDASLAVVHAGRFERNRTNLPGHRVTAAGGGLHATNSRLRVSNTRFDGNEAGYVGGGLYAFGTWSEPLATPRTEVLVANSTFVANAARNDASVSFAAPSEAGALHAEDHTTVRVFHSRFLDNFADWGGAMSVYRAQAEVASSVLVGNRATSDGSFLAVGGTFSVLSTDTPADGATNRRSGSLTVRDSLVQGRSAATGTAAMTGGCLFAGGDGSRRFGENGVAPPASSAATRAQVSILASVFHECDVAVDARLPGSGAGGAMSVSLTALTMDQSLVLQSDASGSGFPSGGGLRADLDSALAVTGSTFARNASRFGGAVYTAGSRLDLSGSELLENAVSDDFGAAVHATPQPERGFAQTGAVAGSVLASSADRGLLIYDGDAAAGPINDQRYDGNVLFDTTTATVYDDALTAPQTAAGLDALVVARNPGVPSTDKSAVANSAPAKAPVAATLLAVPPVQLSTTAAGDAETTSRAYLGYAWSGGAATLDGSPVSGHAGVAAAGPGTHTLAVAGQTLSDTVGTGAVPGLRLAASPQAVATPGSAVTLAWSTAGGTFLALHADGGVPAAGAAGSLVVFPTATTTYRFFLVAEEGGAVGEATVYVGEKQGLLFADGFASGNALAWSAVP